MAKVIDSRITWKLSYGHVCKMFGRQWTKEAKIAICNEHTLIWRSLGYIFVADSILVALQIFEQLCPKAGDANPLVAEPETDFNAKWPFKVIYFGIIEEPLTGATQHNGPWMWRFGRYSERKKRKSPFSTTPLSNPREYPHKAYPARN